MSLEHFGRIHFYSSLFLRWVSGFFFKYTERCSCIFHLPLTHSSSFAVGAIFSRFSLVEKKERNTQRTDEINKFTCNSVVAVDAASVSPTGVSNVLLRRPSRRRKCFSFSAAGRQAATSWFFAYIFIPWNGSFPSPSLRRTYSWYTSYSLTLSRRVRFDKLPFAKSFQEKL